MHTIRKPHPHGAAVPESVRTLLTGFLDYAGLFPPASLDLGTVAANYARYLAGEYHWMVNRLVIPAPRLAELRPLLRVNRARQWRITALLSEEYKRDFKAIVEFHLAAGEQAHVEAVEFKIDIHDELNPILELLPNDMEAYVELVPSRRVAEQIEAIRMARLRAKLRLGGDSASLFPRLQRVARFLSTCAAAGVAFKATAGLHHPLRGVYPLTDARRPPHVPMHGFINLLLAAAGARAGMMEVQLPEILAERDECAFQFRANSVLWNNLKLSTGQLIETRNNLAISVGSCSFEEPVQELQELGIL